MRLWVSAILVGCALAAGCGKNGLEPRGRFAFASLAVSGDAAAVRAALEERARAVGPIAAVFLNGVAVPDDRAGAGHVVAIAPKPANESAFGIADTIVVDETGAVAAADLALLAHGGVELPGRFALGTRVVRRADLATNGVARPAAGDFVMELLRRDHAALLAAPQDHASVRIGLVQLRSDDPRRARAAAEFAAALQARPWVELEVRRADGDVHEQNEAVAAFLGERRIVVVTTDDPASLGDVSKKASFAKVPIIVLDPLVHDDRFCSVWVERTVLGRAAAEAIGRAAPTGGTVIELHGDLDDPIVRKRHEGFLAGLAGG